MYLCAPAHSPLWKCRVREREKGNVLITQLRELIAYNSGVSSAYVRGKIEVLVVKFGSERAAK